MDYGGTSSAISPDCWSGPFDLIFNNAESDDARVLGVRRFNELLAAESRVSATAIQTAWSKGYDGFAIAPADP